VRNDAGQALSLQAYHEATEWIRVSAPGFRRERAGARPAANRQTMIVEGQGMGFWTRVRLPSSPLKRNKSNGIVCCESDLQCRYFYECWTRICNSG